MKYLKCNCGREQVYDRPDFITIKEAESIGWVLIEHQWVCPVCSSALAKYRVEVFIRDYTGKRQSLGKWKTHVENYTLLVEVPEDCRDVFQIELEFPVRSSPEPALANKAVNSLKVTCNDTREKDS